MDIKILQEFMQTFKDRADLDKRFNTLKAFKRLKERI